MDSKEDSQSKGSQKNSKEDSQSSHSDSQDIPGISARDMIDMAFSGDVPASPPSFVSLQEIIRTAEDLKRCEFDMALAHEIAVNKDFVFKENQKKSNLEQQVKEICHQAFWDLLTEQLNSSPPSYVQALVLLQEIKEELISLLLPHNGRLKIEINEVLDLDLVKQQTENNSVDFLSYAQFIISTMARMCAPARDENVQSLRQLVEIVPLYKGILETLQVMKLDMVNFTITTFRPQIQQSSVEYEKQKFKEILKSLESLASPIDGLKFTRMWIQNAYSELAEEVTSPTNAQALHRAFLHILSWKEAKHFPETLYLDHGRFISLRDSLTLMVLTGSILLVTYSSVGPSIQGITEFKKTLKDHVQVLLADVAQCSTEELESKLSAVGLQVAKEVNECLKSHGFSVLNPEKESALVTVIKSTSEEDHSVRKLIKKRLLEFLQMILDGSSEIKIPAGLSSLQQEILSFSGRFLTLARHNKAVFIEYYDKIINQCKES